MGICTILEIATQHGELASIILPFLGSSIYNIIHVLELPEKFGQCSYLPHCVCVGFLFCFVLLLGIEPNSALPHGALPLSYICPQPF